jgi:5,6,7,8-tetrahydromethanopterin hydro-lyase
MSQLEDLDGRFGEAWAGDAPNGSHINLLLAARGSAAAATVATAFATPSAGHTPVMVCLGAGNAVRPATIMMNKATIVSPFHADLTWGAAQLGIGQGVMDAVAEEVLPARLAADLSILVAAWVDPEGVDETAVRIASREATAVAIRDAAGGVHKARLRELIALRDTATNAFYNGE